jgi:hypothetical protein
MRYLDISPENLKDAEMRLKAPRELLGHLAVMSVSGNDVLEASSMRFLWSSRLPVSPTRLVPT